MLSDWNYDDVEWLEHEPTIYGLEAVAGFLLDDGENQTTYVIISKKSSTGLSSFTLCFGRIILI